MFGNKQRKIEKLETKLDSVKAYLPIAEDIHKRVNSAVEDASVHDITIAVNEIFTQAEAQERQRRFLALFHQLPGEYRVKFLARTFSDPEIKQALEVERQRLIAANLVKESIEAISSRAFSTGEIDFRDIPEGADIGIKLYELAPLREIGPAKSITRLYPVRIIGARSLGGGSFRVLADDTATSRFKPVRELQTHQIGQFGSVIKGSEANFSAESFYGTTLGYKDEQNTWRLEAKDTYYNVKVGIVIGCIIIDGSMVMGGPEQAPLKFT